MPRHTTARLRVGIVVFSVVAVAAAGPLAAADAQKDVDAIRDSVVWLAADVTTVIRVQGEEKPRELRDHNEGTGFVVACEAEGDSHIVYVLTCAHVAAGVSVVLPTKEKNSEEITTEEEVLSAKTTELVVTLQDGTEIKDATVVASDCEHDLAVAKFKTAKALPVALLSREPVKERERLGCYGYPLGKDVGGRPHFKTGSCSRLSGTEFDHDIAVLQGMSGGPIFSMTTGRVVGVETSILLEQTGFATAVNVAEAIKGVLVKAGVKVP